MSLFSYFLSLNYLPAQPLKKRPAFLVLVSIGKWWGKVGYLAADLRTSTIQSRYALPVNAALDLSAEWSGLGNATLSQTVFFAFIGYKSNRMHKGVKTYFTKLADLIIQNSDMPMPIGSSNFKSIIGFIIFPIYAGGRY